MCWFKKKEKIVIVEPISIMPDKIGRYLGWTNPGSRSSGYYYEFRILEISKEAYRIVYGVRNTNKDGEWRSIDRFDRIVEYLGE